MSQKNNRSLMVHAAATPTIEYFNATAISPYEIKLEWRINASKPNLYIKIYRKFIDKWSCIAVIKSDHNSFVDNFEVFWGTEYWYMIKLVDHEESILSTSEAVKVVTPIDEEDPGVPIFTWEEYKERKYPFYPDDYLSYNDTFSVYNYVLHGVNITVAIHNSLYGIVSKNTITDFVYHVFKFFHRHWTVFNAFPVKQYKVVVYGEEKEVLGEDELGLRYGPSMLENWGLCCLDEKLSHEIGHAWIGVGILRVEREYDGNFDPETQDSDKWIKEGFDHFYGIVHLDYEHTVMLLNSDLDRYRNEILGTDIDMPLVDMSIYFGTEYMWTYYVKGGLVAYLINKILIDNDEKTLNDFMHYLYKKYNITSLAEQTVDKLISTEDLLYELNSFSLYNFTEFFQKYVYDIEPLPIYKIEMDYVDALRIYNETQGVKVDEAVPRIEIISPANGTVLSNDSVLVEWRAYDIGLGIDHFELVIDNNKTISLVPNECSYLVKNLGYGEHEIVIRAVDKAGNTASVSITIRVEEKSEKVETNIPQINYLLQLLLLGSLLVIIAIVILIGRRRKS